jgi:hypothetical protein
MSAFIVSPACMERVVRAICYRNRYGQILRTFDGIALADEHGKLAKGVMDEIGRRLFTLNIEAIYQCYPDTQDNPDSMPGCCDEDGKSTALTDAASFTVKSSASLFDLVHGLKALQCLRYQCSEGDIPERPLFKELEAALAAVACAIVERMPIYEQAPWD